MLPVSSAANPWLLIQTPACEPLGVALKSAEDLDLPPLLAEHIAAGRFVAFSLADVRVDVPQQAEERFS